MRAPEHYRIDHAAHGKPGSFHPLVFGLLFLSPLSLCSQAVAQQAFTTTAPEKAWQVINEGVAQKSIELRAAAVTDLGLIKNDSKVVALAEAALDDREPAVRAAAALVLAREHEQEILDAHLSEPPRRLHGDMMALAAQHPARNEDHLGIALDAPAPPRRVDALAGERGRIDAALGAAPRRRQPRR